MGRPFDPEDVRLGWGTADERDSLDPLDTRHLHHDGRADLWTDGNR